MDMKVGELQVEAVKADHPMVPGKSPIESVVPGLFGCKIGDALWISLILG